MKYICLGYLEEQMPDGWSEQEQKNFVNECMTYDRDLRKSGNFIGRSITEHSDGYYSSI